MMPLISPKWLIERRLGRRLSYRSFAVISLLTMIVLAGCANDLRIWRDGVGSSVPPAIAPVPLPSRTALNHAPSAQVTPMPAALLSTLSTADQLAQVVVPTRDLRDLTLRLDSTIDEIPLVVNPTPPDYQVGDQLEFWVHNLDTNSNNQITARLIHKTETVYAWVEEGQDYDQDAIARSIDRFSLQSYPAEVDFFGSEWYPGVDNDPRLHILHAAGVGSGVAGYYSSADEYSRLANPYSNEKEMFYVNLRWLNNSSAYDYYETVLAHEFQHMIHWFKDRNEATWLNEGLSEYAQEVAGYGSDTVFASSFVRTPDTQLNTWRVDSSSNAEHYGGSYLLVNYLTQRFGSETTRALVAQPANGISGVTDALRAMGHDLDFDGLFADWVIANYVEDPDALGLDGFYGYRNLDLPTPPVETELVTNTPALYQATVSNYATDYIELPQDRTIVYRFQGQAETRLANTAPYSGNYAWWSHRGDDSDSRLTRKFDLRSVSAEAAAATPLTMEVAMWWNIEADYDYGYVLASRDGEKWEMLEGAMMTSTNPSGNNFGIGYSGESEGWVTETFDLSPYAGSEIWIRFEYVTDDAANASGWFIDDLRIDSIDYFTDFETELEGWESEGWLLTDNTLLQRWLLQLMLFDGDELVAVEAFPVTEDGRATIAWPEQIQGQQAILTVSALAPISTEPAQYELRIQE